MTRGRTSRWPSLLLAGRVGNHPRWLLPRPVTSTVAAATLLLSVWMAIDAEQIRWRDHLGVPALALALVVVGRWPLASWLLLLPLLASPLWGDQSGVNLLAVLLLAPAIMAAGNRVLVAVALATLTGWVLVRGLVSGLAEGFSSPATAALATISVLFGLAVRQLCGGWRASEVEVADVERTMLEVRALQRRQLAQEMHDGVAHEIEAIRRRADEALLGPDDEVPAALTEIEDRARAALTELRGLLSVLRDRGGPLPGGDDHQLDG